MLRVPKGENALLRARLFLVAARATDGSVETVFVQRLFQRHRLHHIGMHRRAVRLRRDALAHALFIDMYADLDVAGGSYLVAQRDHLAKFPGGIHVQQRHRRTRRVKGLAQKMQ